MTEDRTNSGAGAKGFSAKRANYQGQVIPVLWSQYRDKAWFSNQLQPKSGTPNVPRPGPELDEWD